MNPSTTGDVNPVSSPGVIASVSPVVTLMTAHAVAPGRNTTWYRLSPIAELCTWATEIVAPTTSPATCFPVTPNTELLPFGVAGTTLSALSSTSVTSPT